jgi:RNA polymerase sigma-70 factor (ECF subfamily)
VVDDELIRALHAEHGDALFALALRVCVGDRHRAEDLVQETLLRAWRHPEALVPERGPARAWLFTTA